MKLNVYDILKEVIKINTKLMFGVTVNDLDSRLPKSRGDCFNYGSVSGCDSMCPQLQRGECQGDVYTILKDIIDENIDILYNYLDKNMYVDVIKELLKEQNI